MQIYYICIVTFLAYQPLPMTESSTEATYRTFCGWSCELNLTTPTGIQLWLTHLNVIHSFRSEISNHMSELLLVSTNLYKYREGNSKPVIHGMTYVCCSMA